MVRTDVVEVPTTEAGRDRWQHLSTAIAVDKGPDGKLTGTLDVQLLNEGSQPVYFDSLTIRHPQPALLVSQENHYYPVRPEPERGGREHTPGRDDEQAALQRGQRVGG